VPKRQNVNAAVGPPADGVVAQADRRRGAGPGLHPRNAALFELLGNSPMKKVEQRLSLKRNLANPLYKPPVNQEALDIKVDRILHYANEVSQPDN